MTNGIITWKEFPQPISAKKVDGVTTVKSKYTGDLEEGRMRIVKNIVNLILPTTMATKLAFSVPGGVLAATEGANKIREGFMQIIEVFTAIAEPILWFYALIGAIMIATGKSKDKGLERIKQVGYAYIVITLLPTIFQMLRWIAEMLKGAMTF